MVRLAVTRLLIGFFSYVGADKINQALENIRFQRESGHSAFAMQNSSGNLFVCDRRLPAGIRQIPRSHCSPHWTVSLSHLTVAARTKRAPHGLRTLRDGAIIWGRCRASDLAYVGGFLGLARGLVMVARSPNPNISFCPGTRRASHQDRECAYSKRPHCCPQYHDAAESVRETRSLSRFMALNTGKS